MKIDVRRGLKTGLLSATMISVILPANYYLDGRSFTWSEIVIAVVFVGLSLTIIGSFTDKIGVDFGDT